MPQILRIGPYRTVIRPCGRTQEQGLSELLTVRMDPVLILSGRLKRPEQGSWFRPCLTEPQLSALSSLSAMR